MLQDMHKIHAPPSCALCHTPKWVFLFPSFHWFGHFILCLVPGIRKEKSNVKEWSTVFGLRTYERTKKMLGGGTAEFVVYFLFLFITKIEGKKITFSILLYFFGRFSFPF